MSIDLSNLDKEAFTLSETTQEYVFARRPFPPLFDCAQDISNAQKRAVFFRSIVHLSEDDMDPMSWCGGVHGFFYKQKVQALCFTDNIIGSHVEQFNIILSAFVLLYNCRGKEVAANRAFLSYSNVEEITCATGILDHVKAKILRIGSAVVLNECAIEKIIFDPEMGSKPLCSRSKVLGKQVRLQVGSHHSFVNPMVHLVKTKMPTSMSEEIIFTVQEHDIEAKAVAENTFETLLTDFARPNAPIYRYNNRGSYWHNDFLEGVINIAFECSICLERLPNRVIGHYATASSDTDMHRVHAFCTSCWHLYKDQCTAPNNGKIPCPLCRREFKHMGLFLSRDIRFSTRLERSYAQLMGLDELLRSAKAEPAASADTTRLWWCSIL